VGLRAGSIAFMKDDDGAVSPSYDLASLGR